VASFYIKGAAYHPAPSVTPLSTEEEDGAIALWRGCLFPSCQQG